MLTNIRPFGVGLCQHWDEAGAIIQIVNDFQVCNFVELGILNGGLTALIGGFSRYNADFAYLGVEKNPAVIDPRIMDNHHDQLIVGDCFADSVYEQVGKFVARPGMSLVFCDNGDKPRELLHYWSCLKPGDLIMAHDYAPAPGGESEINDRHFAHLLGPLTRLAPGCLHGTRLLLLGRS